MVTYLPATWPWLLQKPVRKLSVTPTFITVSAFHRLPPPQSYCLGFPNRTPQVQKTEAMTRLGQDFLNLSPSSLAASSSLLTSQALISKCAHVLSPASLATLDHLAVPQFCKHLLRPLSKNCASFQLPPPPPPPTPATSSPPAQPVGSVTAAAEARAPRERPERRRCMAGSDTSLPRDSRGNGGWRQLKRDRSRPPELAGLDEGGERPWEGFSPVLFNPVFLSRSPSVHPGPGPFPLSAPGIQ